MAATLPRLMNESRQLLEIHLAEYRRQTKSQLNDLAAFVQKENTTLKTITDDHANAAVLAAEKIEAQLNDAQAVAKSVKAQIESAASEWLNVKRQMFVQCKKLEEVSDDLQDRFAWRIMLLWAAWFALALGLGISIGYYWIHKC
jgi:uncharacterized phage infection (PIP) family protein YhgE